MKKVKIVLFVEGDTDIIFFKALLDYYRKHSKKEIAMCDVVNLQGVTRYTSKLTGKLKNEFLPKAKAGDYELRAVCCSYDTDVFEFSGGAPVDWKKVEREVKRLKIKEFCRVEVEQMIEDWLLDDMQGLCSFLKIKKTPTSLKGKNAYERIQALFKLGNKLYLKGAIAKTFVPMLDMAIIRNKRKDALTELERILSVEL